MLQLSERLREDEHQIGFHPDLVIEVTTVCDRACPGCYANNFLSKKNKQEIYKEFPSMFLSKNTLKTVMSKNPYVFNSVAIRGGEPTRHPELIDLLEISESISKTIYIETHGRWILEESFEELLPFLKGKENMFLKISFDQMHGLSSKKLEEICKRLSALDVNYCLAITEKDYSKFLKQREKCSWIEDNSKFIFQKKAISQDELIHPNFGVIGVNGIWSSALNYKESFKEAL